MILYFEDFHHILSEVLRFVWRATWTHLWKVEGQSLTNGISPYINPLCYPVNLPKCSIGFGFWRIWLKISRNGCQRTCRNPGLWNPFDSDHHHRNRNSPRFHKQYVNMGRNSICPPNAMFSLTEGYVISSVFFLCLLNLETHLRASFSIFLKTKRWTDGP